MGAARDLTGRRFGRLVAERSTKKRRHGNVVWECKCDCGEKKWAMANNLVKKRVRSCGCLRMPGNGYLRANANDISGVRFHRLIAIRPIRKRQGGEVVWRCSCDCGKTHIAKASDLKSGNTKSCGCLLLDTRSKEIEVSCRQMIGRRFRRLVVIRRSNKSQRKSVWECKCDCGSLSLHCTGSLMTGRAQSCGCLRTATSMARFMEGVSPDDIPYEMVKAVMIIQKLKRKIRDMKSGRAVPWQEAENHNQRQS